MSLPVPGPARPILLLALQLASLDLLPADQLYEKILTFDEEADSPVNEYFDQGGVSSKLAIPNLGSNYLYLIMTIIIGLTLALWRLLITMCPPR